MEVSEKLLSDLEEKAKAAHSNEWRDCDAYMEKMLDQICSDSEEFRAKREDFRAGIKYMAAARPEVVLALVDKIRRQKALIEWLTADKKEG